MKIAGVETLEPYISCLYIGPKDESGNRYIRYNNVEEDQTLQAYVQELEQDPEVKALYDDVNARYQEALNSDPTLAEFVQNATGKANENTEAAEEEAPAADEAAEQEDAQEETGEEPAAEEQNEEQQRKKHRQQRHRTERPVLRRVSISVRRRLRILTVLPLHTGRCHHTD